MIEATVTMTFEDMPTAKAWISKAEDEGVRLDGELDESTTEEYA